MRHEATIAQRGLARNRVPRSAFINKRDRIGADFDHSIRSMRQRLSAPRVETDERVERAKPRGARREQGRGGRTPVRHVTTP